MSDTAIFKIIGLIVMNTGIYLFIRHRGEGSNSIKILGVEVSLSAPSLVVFMSGAMLLAFPYTSWFREAPSPLLSRQQINELKRLNAETPKNTRVVTIIHMGRDGLAQNMSRALSPYFEQVSIRQPDMIITESDTEDDIRHHVSYYLPSDRNTATEIANLLQTEIGGTYEVKANNIDNRRNSDIDVVIR